MGKKQFSTEYSYIIPEGFVKTAGDYLRIKEKYSTRVINMLKREGELAVNGEAVPFVTPVKGGDKLKLCFPREKPDCDVFDLPIDVIFEDKNILIVNKPAGLVVHPTKSHSNETLSGAVYAYWQKTGFCGKARYVNRLDMDTTGVVVIAKNKYVHHFLQDESLNGQTEKHYVAAVKGCMEQDSGVIDAAIERESDESFVRTVSESGKASVTEYEVIARHPDYTIVKLSLKSGRTHQIRVHMNYIGHPVLGDTLYGAESALINRQALHAYFYSFIHPETKQRICFTAALPSDILKLLTDSEKALF